MIASIPVRKVLYAVGVSAGLWVTAARRAAVRAAAAAKRAAVACVPAVRWFAAGAGLGLGLNAAGGTAIQPAMIVAIAAAALPIAAAAAFCYVLFRFLAVLVATDRLVAADATEARGRVARALGVAPAPAQTPTDGSFHVTTDADAYVREQLEALGQAGVLHGADIDEILKEGHAADFDFEQFRKSARGEHP